VAPGPPTSLLGRAHYYPEVYWLLPLLYGARCSPSPPFDILEATYLAPAQDFGVSTEELISIRAQQLAKCPEDLAQMRDTVTESRIKNLERFEKQHSSRIIDFDFSLALSFSSATIALKRPSIARPSLVTSVP